MPHIPPLPTGPFRFVALDVETASREAASICQIGLACVDHHNAIHAYSVLVNPESPFASFNVELHGIGPQTVAGATTFPEIWQVMAPFLQPYHLVQHSQFDSRAIAAACRAYRLPEPDLSWSDSVRIARKAWPEYLGNGGHGLGHLKKVLELEFTHHDAGEDARASAEVVLLAEERLGAPFEQIAQVKYKAQMSLPIHP